MHCISASMVNDQSLISFLLPCIMLQYTMWHNMNLINPSSPKGGCNNPQTSFTLVLKIAQPRGKIAPRTFKFILSLHFSEKILSLPPTPGVG